MQTLEDMYQEISRCKGVFEDRGEWDGWLFEYACKTAEWEGIDPKLAPKYLTHVMQQKLQNVVFAVRVCYCTDPNATRFDIHAPDLSEIEGIVRKEHGGGLQIR